MLLPADSSVCKVAARAALSVYGDKGWEVFADGNYSHRISIKGVTFGTVEPFDLGLPQVLSFQGTDERGDWLTNGNVLPLDVRHGSVHSGFYYSWQGVKTTVSSLVDTDRPLIITGHSQGAAIAAMAALWFAKNCKHHNIYCVLFGCAPCMSPGVQKFLNKAYGERACRFENDEDVVPMLGLPWFGEPFGLHYFDGKGKLRTEPAKLGLTLKRSLKRVIGPNPLELVSDHSMTDYAMNVLGIGEVP